MVLALIEDLCRQLACVATDRRACSVWPKWKNNKPFLVAFQTLPSKTSMLL